MKKFLVLALLLLAACADPPTHGIVMGKHYYPAHTEQRMVCYTYEKGVCTFWMPQTDYYDAEWEVTFRGVDSEGDPDNYDTDVSEEMYNICDLGVNFIGADSDYPKCERR